MIFIIFLWNYTEFLTGCCSLHLFLILLLPGYSRKPLLLFVSKEKKKEKKNEGEKEKRNRLLLFCLSYLFL